MGKTFKDRKMGSYRIIQVPDDVSICVIGDVHEHSDQFFELLNKWKPSKNRWLVSVGDVYDKGYGIKTAEKITEALIDLKNDNVGYAVRGNHEVKLIKKNKPNLTKYLKWWQDQPLVITFEFNRGKRITVLHAGVSPLMKQESLGRDIEVVYVRDVDVNGRMIPLIWKMIDGVNTLVKSVEGGSCWHDVYDGRFGYIVSGHAAQKDGEAKYYNYSCNLDSGVYDSGKLTGQVFLSNGNLGEKIVIEGPAFKPKLNISY